MNSDRLLRITTRIHVLLVRELGQGIDILRMINERRYARDVLLVCDAQPGTDLASLAEHFRTTRAALADAALAAASEPPKGFGVTLSSLFGTDFEVSRPSLDSRLGEIGTPPAAARRWASPARWLRA